MVRKKTSVPQWQANENRWRLRVQKDGQRRAFYSNIPGRRGAMECQEKADQWLRGAAVPADAKVEEAFKNWVAEVSVMNSEQSALTHERFGRNYIIPAIGNMSVRDLTNEQVLQNIINSAFLKGTNGKPLARKTLQNLRGTLMQFVRYCRKCGYTTLVPENLVVPRKAGKVEKQILQPHEIRVLFSEDSAFAPHSNQHREVSQTEWFIHAFRFVLLTGLRPGELIGLRWTDNREGVLKIQRSINYFGQITDGKNENARREMQLTEFSLRELDQQREMLKEAEVESEYIFPDVTGAPANQKQLRRHLQKYCERHGLTIVSPYELRHTWYSINKTMPAELVKRVGGHSASMDTFGVYGHAVDGELQQAAKMLQATMQNLLYGTDPFLD